MSQIIKLMKAMGYPNISEEGVCLGLAHTMLDAHFKASRNAMVEIHKKLVSLNSIEFDEILQKLKDPKPELQGSDEETENIRVFLDSVYLYQKGYEQGRAFSSNPNAILRSENDLYIDVLLGEEKR